MTLSVSRENMEEGWWWEVGIPSPPRGDGDRCCLDVVNKAHPQAVVQVVLPRSDGPATIGCRHMSVHAGPRARSRATGAATFVKAERSKHKQFV